MPAPTHSKITVVGIDIGKNSFHVVGLDKRGAIALRQKGASVADKSGMSALNLVLNPIFAPPKI